MENTEIMSNNEVMEVTEDLATAGSGTGLKIVGGAAVIVGLAYGAYKLITKIKAKKEQLAKTEENYASEDECCENVE